MAAGGRGIPGRTHANRHAPGQAERRVKISARHLLDPKLLVDAGRGGGGERQVDARGVAICVWAAEYDAPDSDIERIGERGHRVDQFPRGLNALSFGIAFGHRLGVVDDHDDVDTVGRLAARLGHRGEKEGGGDRSKRRSDGHAHGGGAQPGPRFATKRRPQAPAASRSPGQAHSRQPGASPRPPPLGPSPQYPGQASAAWPDTRCPPSPGSRPATSE